MSRLSSPSLCLRIPPPFPHRSIPRSSFRQEMENHSLPGSARPGVQFRIAIHALPSRDDARMILATQRLSLMDLVPMRSISTRTAALTEWSRVVYLANLAATSVTREPKYFASETVLAGSSSPLAVAETP